MVFLTKNNSLQSPPPPPPRGGKRFSCLSAVGLSLPFCALLLAACDFQEKFDEADREMDAVAEMLAEVRPADSAAGFGSVRLVDRHPYIGAARIETDPGAGLPEYVLGKGAVILPQGGMVSDAALAGQIEEVTGIPVHFVGPAPVVEDEGGAGAGALAVWRERTGPAGVLWSGSLDALLDGWAEAAGYEWRFDEERERIEVVRFRSVVFHVHALAGSQSYSAQSSASDGGSTEGGSASSEHSLESSAQFNPWGEINDQLVGLVGEATKLTVSESSGTVVVAGVPGDVGRVRAYLAHLNQEVLRPVSGEFGLVRERSRSSPLRMAGAVAAVLVVMVGGVWVLAPDMLSGLFGEAEKEESEAEQEEPQVWALIDSVALVEECGTAQLEWPPYLPAWEIGRIACHGWFEEPALIGERPELEGRAVMVVQWELPGQYVAALHRRIAEEHLGRWYYAQVGDTSAWALMPLGSVIRSGDDATAPSHLAFRRDVDRHFGMQGARIAYGGAGDGVAVTVALGQGLSRIEGLVAGTPGFELLSLTRAGSGGWVLAARPQAGFLVRESVFEALASARRGVDAAS